MEFGKIEHIEKIDFSLPGDDRITKQLWQRLDAADPRPVRIYVGCPRWAVSNWIGKVYPRGTKEKDFLALYVKQFNCIELNMLFYHLQPKSVIGKWAMMAPAAFRFCPKFSNTISHQLQLKDAGRDTGLFIDHMRSFGDRLGPSFLQLPDPYGPDRALLLQEYLRELPRDFQTCVELRHSAWFAGEDGPLATRDHAAVQETLEGMLENGIGTVITDTPGRRDVLHMRLTAPLAFIRFASCGIHAIDYRRIDSWADRIKQWIDQGLREIYFFVHNHEEIDSPEYSRYAVERFNLICGTNIQPPRLLKDEEGKNLSLF